MNTADNIHAFATAEQRKKAKKALMSVEAACIAKSAPEGKVKRKFPKPKVLQQRYTHNVSKKDGIVLHKWVVYADQINPVNDDIYVADPFSGTRQYFDSRKEAREIAAYMNTTYLTKKLGLLVYRVAPVTVTVAF
jgi:hypothetical protein